MAIRNHLGQCFSKFRQLRTTSLEVGAHADHNRKFPNTQKGMQVKLGTEAENNMLHRKWR
jgi:hypothetical protein